MRVRQDTELGSLGISALVEAGFCGPNCGLSDIDVRVTEVGELFDVSFYDMSTLVGSHSRFYQEIKDAYSQRSEGV